MKHGLLIAYELRLHQDSPATSGLKEWAGIEDHLLDHDLGWVDDAADDIDVLLYDLSVPKKNEDHSSKNIGVRLGDGEDQSNSHVRKHPRVSNLQKKPIGAFKCAWLNISISNKSSDRALRRRRKKLVTAIRNLMRGRNLPHHCFARLQYTTLRLLLSQLASD